MRMVAVVNSSVACTKTTVGFGGSRPRPEYHPGKSWPKYQLAGPIEVVAWRAVDANEVIPPATRVEAWARR